MDKEILKSVRKEIILKSITSILVMILLLIIPLIYSKGIDYITVLNINKAYRVFILFLIIYIIYHIIDLLNQLAFQKLYSKIYKKYVELSLYKTCGNSLYSLSRFSLSEYSNILTEDIESLSEYYSTLIIRIVEIIEFIYIIIYFFFINKIIGIITLIMSIIVITILLYFNLKISKTNEIRKSKNDRRISLFQEIFNSIKLIKGYNIYNKIKNNLIKDIDDYIKWNNKLVNDKYKLKELSLIIVSITKSIILIYSVYLIKQDIITIGILTLIFNYYTKISDLFASIILLNESLTNMRVSKLRLNKLYEYASNVLNSRENNNDIGIIEFKDVLYGNRTKPILNKVSFKIEANSLNIIISNKNEGLGIYDLLMKYNRIHEGSILIDNMDINTYDSNISLIMNNPFFFNKSITENMMLFEDNFDNIVSVCKYLDIDKLIMNLDDGYGTIMNNNISNDLKYMLSFAKIFFNKSKIILIEDFFNNLSNYYEKKVLSIIYSLKKEHTIIILSNNIDIINNKNVDKILIFDNNKLLIDTDNIKNIPEYSDFIEKL